MIPTALRLGFFLRVLFVYRVLGLRTGLGRASRLWAWGFRVQVCISHVSLHVGAGVASLPAAVHLPSVGVEGASQVHAFVSSFPSERVLPPCDRDAYGPFQPVIFVLLSVITEG